MQCKSCGGFGHCVLLGQVCHAAAKQANIDLWKEKNPEQYEKNRLSFTESNKPKTIKKISASPEFPLCQTADEFDRAVQDSKEDVRAKHREIFGDEE